MRLIAQSQVVSVKDLNPRQALQATVQMRMSANQGTETEEAYREVTATVGGRLSYLAKIAKHPNMLSQAEQMLRLEKAWLLSQIGLIPDHDDDVMDEVCNLYPLVGFRRNLTNRRSKNGAPVRGCYSVNS